MKRIIFLRHAKAEIQHWGQPDFDRCLEARGIQDSLKLCTYLKTHPINPDIILCSPSKRTTQTLQILQEHLPTLPTSSLRQDLYLASAGDILELINQQNETTSTLMIIGHNPGLADIILQLIHNGNTHEMSMLTHKFTTCGMVILALHDSKTWRDIVPDCATLERYIYPKMLGVSENTVM